MKAITTRKKVLLVIAGLILVISLALIYQKSRQPDLAKKCANEAELSYECSKLPLPNAK